MIQYRQKKAAYGLAIALMTCIVCVRATADDVDKDANQPPLEVAPVVPRTALVILDAEYPIFIQVDLLIKSKESVPLADAWRAGAKADFKRLDENNDKRLSDEELSKAYWVRSTQISSLARRSGIDTSTLSSLVAKLFVAKAKDDEEAATQEVTPESTPGIDFEAYIDRRLSELPPMKFSSNVLAASKVDRLWEVIDQSKSQALESVEWDQAGSRIARLDVNGDRVLQELEPKSLDNPFSNQVAPRGGLAMGTSLMWVAWPSENASEGERKAAQASMQNLSKELARRHRESKDMERLAAAPMWKDLAKSFDKDHNGQLDLTEWDDLLLEGELPFVAHCQVEIAIKKSQSQPQPVAPAYAPTANAVRLLKSSTHPSIVVQSHGNWVRIQGAGVSVRLTAAPAMYDPLDTAVGSFKSQVDKTKGYMSRVESQRIYPLNILFEPADLDGDGKLYEEELSQFVDETRKQTGQSATVAVTNRGERLFSCLDRNADGLVDPREQQAIPETLQKYDTNLDDQIQRHELPTNYDIVFRKGQIKLLEQAIGVVDQLQSASPPLPVDAPKWFRLLDRNRDGIVERVEYPGRGAEFKKLDANGDGDVSIAEAKEAAAPK